MKLRLQQFEAHLWGAANILRGKTAGQDYKNYCSVLKIALPRAVSREWSRPMRSRRKVAGLCSFGSSHKCVHDLAPGRSATAVGRRCGCTRARYATAQSSVAQSTAACAGPALGGGPARRQPDQTQAADSMALTRRRTVKDRRTQPRLSPTFYARAEPSLTVQPRWNWQPRHDSAACCGRTFREPATPLQIQTVFFSHVSH